MSKPIQAFRKLGVLLPALGLLGASLSVPRTARANSGKFLETMGISIAVGTVLGASTLPFYDQPGKHVINFGYGAATGAAVGLGVLVYGLVTGPSHEGFDDYAKSRSSSPLLAHSNVRAQLPAPPALFWTPVVSLTW